MYLGGAQADLKFEARFFFVPFMGAMHERYMFWLNLIITDPGKTNTLVCILSLEITFNERRKISTPFIV